MQLWYVHRSRKVAGFIHRIEHATVSSREAGEEEVIKVVKRVAKQGNEVHIRFVYTWRNRDTESTIPQSRFDETFENNPNRNLRASISSPFDQSSSTLRRHSSALSLPAVPSAAFIRKVGSAGFHTRTLITWPVETDRTHATLIVGLRKTGAGEWPMVSAVG